MLHGTYSHIKEVAAAFKRFPKWAEWGSVCIDWKMNQTSGSGELLLEELGFEREAAEFTCKVGGLGLERETGQEQDTAGWVWTDDQMRGYAGD